MYIEFCLPQGASGLSATHAILFIRKDLIEWSIKYRIQYKEKFVKDKIKVTFSDPEHYTFFGLTWEPAYQISSRYRLVEPMAKPPK